MAFDEDDVVIPAMLRSSRGAYAHAIRRRLRAAGFGDVPRNGPHVLGGMGNHGIPAQDLIRELGARPEAVARLVDSLLSGGYVLREPGGGDQELELTDRGRAAARVVGEAVRAVDEELAGMISPAELDGLRAGLIALCGIRERYEAER